MQQTGCALKGQFNLPQPKIIKKKFFPYVFDYLLFL